MIKNVTFDAVTPQDVVSLLKKSNTLVVSSINYEQRTLKWISTLPGDSLEAKFKILVLRSMYNNIGLLEYIKNRNIEQAKKRLENLKVSYELVRITYPAGFDRDVMKQTIRSMYQEVGGDSELNIILEITGLPRAIIFCILHAIYELQQQRKLPLYLYIIYTTAQEYPHIEYPHEVGTLVTYFSNKCFHDFLRNGDNLNLLVIPGIYGFETCLLIEELKKIDLPKVNFHFLVPLYQHDMLASMKVLRMNPSVLRARAYNAKLHFSFSLQDAMKMVLDLTDWEVEEDAKCLIAPFNVKPLAVSAFYAYIRLLEKGMRNVDILRMSGLQYGSLYSLGAGEINYWKVNINESEDKNLSGK